MQTVYEYIVKHWPLWENNGTFLYLTVKTTNEIKNIDIMDYANKGKNAPGMHIHKAFWVTMYERGGKLLSEWNA